MSQKKVARNAGDEHETSETTPNRRVKTEAKPSQLERKKIRPLSQTVSKSGVDFGNSNIAGKLGMFLRCS